MAFIVNVKSPTRGLVCVPQSTRMGAASYGIRCRRNGGAYEVLALAVSFRVDIVAGVCMGRDRAVVLEATVFITLVLWV